MELKTIMTADPRSVGPDTSLEEAVRVMDTTYVRHLPVVSEAGRLIGVVSDRDLLEATGWLPAAAGAEPTRRASRVEEIMHLHVVTASPEDTVVTAAVDLVGRKIGCLPILRDGILVGIVSESDLVGAYLRRLDALGGGEDDPRVEHVMTWHPTTITADASLAEARRLMRVDDMRHLPVTEGERLVGMLSDRDLRRAYGSGRSKDTAVAEVMTRDVRTLSTSCHASDAARIFAQNRISAAPVIDPGGDEPVLAGIVTVTDILDHSLGTLRLDGPVSSAG